MQIATSNALLRALSACAKILRTPHKTAPPKGTAPLALNAHMARDIGLTTSELERLNHQWPSQTTQHPHL